MERDNKKRRFSLFKFLLVILLIAALLFIFTGFYVTEGSVLGLHEGVYWYYKGPNNMDMPFILTPSRIPEGQGILGSFMGFVKVERFVKENTIVRFPYFSLKTEKIRD